MTNKINFLYLIPFNILINILLYKIYFYKYILKYNWELKKYNILMYESL